MQRLEWQQSNVIKISEERLLPEQRVPDPSVTERTAASGWEKGGEGGGGKRKRAE